jgi:hypothetical protein
VTEAKTRCNTTSGAARDVIPGTESNNSTTGTLSGASWTELAYGPASVFSEQLTDANLQRTRNLQQAPNRRIPKPAFDTGQIGPIQIRRFRQPFLRPALRVPQLAYPQTKGFNDRRL